MLSLEQAKLSYAFSTSNDRYKEQVIYCEYAMISICVVFCNKCYIFDCSLFLKLPKSVVPPGGPEKEAAALPDKEPLLDGEESA